MTGWRPTAEALARARSIAARTLGRAEYAAASRIPVTAEERAETRELVRWFTSHYPTPLERLAYVRRAYRRWSAHSPGSGGGQAGPPD